MSLFGFLRKYAEPCTRQRPSRHKSLLHLEYLEDRTVPTLLGQSLFPADNPWNQQITNAPVAANSTAILSNIITRYGDGQLHPDFGQDLRNSNDLYGIPYNIVHGNTVPKVPVVIDGYPDESDIQMAPILSGVVIEGDFQNGPRVGVDNRGDSHLIVWDQDNNIAYELYRASRPSENGDGKWHADQETIWDMKTNTFRTLGFTSADAAGLAILPGLVRPDEALPVSQGGQGAIHHAIRFTLQNAIILDQFLYPASHAANPGNNNPSMQPPMGARFRLKASVDISSLGPQARIVAQAMKDYGMIVADNGSNFFFSGASYAVDANNQFTATWNDNDIQSTLTGLKALHYSDFEMVDLAPIVTGLSAASGAAGDSITIIGQNFSGAAGRLTVTFAGVASSSVTYIDDSHLQARVPSGTGTVDVRVQSGVTTPANSDNLKNTIFGYGISAVTTADRFTFGGPPVNQPPTVAANVTVSANPTVGSPTSLHVLGADDAGEPNLTYTWTVSGPAVVSLSGNGTNAARSTNASFTQPGTYYFTVTLRDAGGLSVATGAIVTVAGSASNQPPTIASNVTVSANPIVGSPTLLNVLGADDGGASNLTYTWTVSGPAAVSFSANGNNAARSTNASFTQAGTYYFTVTLRDTGGLSVATGAIVTVASATNMPPTLAASVAVSANSMVGPPTTLSVLGADDGGASNLTYTWTVSGPAAVSFSANGSNAARNTSATFSAAGTYYITVTIRDAGGLSVATGAIVTVASSTNKPPTIANNVTASQNPVTGSSTNLSVLGADDGGEPHLTYTWTVSGPAAVSFSANGTNAARNTTATFTLAGTYYITVTMRDAGSLSVATGAILTVNRPPTVATAASASPTTITGTTTNLSVLGADDGGVSNLRYTWSTVTMPTGAAAPTFSINGTNAARNTVATFTKKGSYTLRVTILDAGGLSVTSQVTVSVV